MDPAPAWSIAQRDEGTERFTEELSRWGWDLQDCWESVSSRSTYGERVGQYAELRLQPVDRTPRRRTTSPPARRGPAPRARVRDGGALPLFGRCQALGIAGGGATLSGHRLG